MPARAALPDWASRLPNLASSDLCDMSSGYLDSELQPTELLIKASQRAARRKEAWARPPLEGVAELRQLFATEARVDLSPNHVLIMPGAQSAITSCLRSLTTRGDTVLMESPTYDGAINAVRSAELLPFGVPADADGIRTDLLADAFEQTAARVLYMQPRWLNPSGSRLSEQRRAEVLEIAEHFNAFLIEDDCARDLDFSAEPFAPLLADDVNGHVIYVRSLTKHNSPGLRIGCVIAQGAAFSRIRATRSADGAFAPALLQYIACELLTTSAWQRHLTKVRAELRTRRDTLRLGIETVRPDWTLQALPNCGVHLWFETNDTDTFELARINGVLVADGARYFPTDATASYIRVSYGGLPAERLQEGIARLAGRPVE